MKIELNVVGCEVREIEVDGKKKDDKVLKSVIVVPFNTVLAKEDYEKLIGACDSDMKLVVSIDK